MFSVLGRKQRLRHNSHDPGGSHGGPCSTFQRLQFSAGPKAPCRNGAADARGPTNNTISTIIAVDGWAPPTATVSAVLGNVWFAHICVGHVCCMLSKSVNAWCVVHVDGSHAYAHARTHRAQPSDLVALGRTVCLKLWPVQSRPRPPTCTRRRASHAPLWAPLATPRALDPTLLLLLSSMLWKPLLLDGANWCIATHAARIATRE